MSQGDCGISLLNDCKYGFQAKENMIGLTMLRSSKDPDPESDMGEHSFTYSIFPHEGDWRQAGTHWEALDLNDPIDVLISTGKTKGELKSTHSFVYLEAEGVALEALKKAEDSEEMIIRIVERHGSRTKGLLYFDCPILSVSECNLMEQAEKKIAFMENKISFLISPYEIKTFKIKI